VLFGAGGVLAGLLVFGPAPLYPAYAAAGPRLLGLSPLRDQQLAGITMIAEQLLSLGVCAYFMLRLRSLAVRDVIVGRVREAVPDH
jgi:Cytochrome c oxidase caa3 assembly factor (Caa3_CtaG)